MDSERVSATLDEVRLAIFRQLTQLTELLDELESAATAVVDGGDPAALSAALDVLHPRFAHHLAYEERHLPRWLPPSEEERVLLGDHEEQWRALQGLLHDRVVFADARSLAREALTFVHRLRRDLVVEDGALRSLRDPAEGGLAATLHPQRRGGPTMNTTPTSLETSVTNVLADLETLTDQIRVKLHLVNMEAKKTWNEELEPRLFEARVHATEAKDASKAAIEATLKAFKDFSATL